MKPGDLVAISADNSDQGIGILLYKDGEVWRVIRSGQTTYWLEQELSLL
jgi:hypothetical protein